VIHILVIVAAKKTTTMNHATLAGDMTSDKYDSKDSTAGVVAAHVKPIVNSQEKPTWGGAAAQIQSALRQTCPFSSQKDKHIHDTSVCGGDRAVHHQK